MDERKKVKGKISPAIQGNSHFKEDHFVLCNIQLFKNCFSFTLPLSPGGLCRN